MEISFDQKADALYIKFQDEKFSKNKKIDDNTIIDFGKKGKILGIELLNASKRVSIKNLAGVRVNLN